MRARTSPQSQRCFTLANISLQAGCADLGPRTPLCRRGPQGTHTRLSIALRAPSPWQHSGEIKQQGLRLLRARRCATATRPMEPSTTSSPGLNGTLRLCQEPRRHHGSRHFEARAWQQLCAALAAVPTLSHGKRGDGAGGHGSLVAVGNKDTQPAAIWTDSLIPPSLRTPHARCPPRNSRLPMLLPVLTRGGGHQGTPAWLGDPWGRRGRRRQEMLPLPQHMRGHLKSSSSTVKSSQEQKLLLPCLPALHRAEPSTTHPTQHHQRDERTGAFGCLQHPQPLSFFGQKARETLWQLREAAVPPGTVPAPQAG